MARLHVYKQWLYKCCYLPPKKISKWKNHYYNYRRVVDKSQATTDKWETTADEWQTTTNEPQITIAESETSHRQL